MNLLSTLYQGCKLDLFILLELLLYFYCSFIVLENIYGYYSKNKKLLFVVPLIYIPFVIVELLLKNDLTNLSLISIFLINILLLKWLFNNAKVKSIICILFILYLLDIVISSIVVFILNIANNMILKEFIGLIINIVLSVFCIIICKIKRLVLQAQFSMIPLNVKRITMLSLISSTVVISLISDYGAVKDISKWEVSIRVTLLILIIIIGSAFPIMIANAIGKSFYTQQSKIFERQIKTQANHYAILSKSNYELRRFKHDYKNLCIGINKYIKDGDFESAEKMLKNCDSLLIQATNSLVKFDTGNGIVDAILTEKQEKAKNNNIVITFEGAISTNAIVDTDLCVLFGNTLDNAIEACEKIKTDNKKIISVVCKFKCGFMFLKITNPVAENITIYNNSIKTTKQDKSNHGFGLYSIQKIVKKYDGTLAFSCENKTFTCEISLNI